MECLPKSQQIPEEWNHTDIFYDHHENKLKIIGKEVPWKFLHICKYKQNTSK